jgi:hypothetical protein
MVGLAFLVLAAGAALNHGAGDLFALGVALLVSAVTGLFLLSDFRETRSGFPWPEGQLSGDAPSVRPFEHSVHPTR